MFGIAIQNCEMTERRIHSGIAAFALRRSTRYPAKGYGNDESLYIRLQSVKRLYPEQFGWWYRL